MGDLHAICVTEIRNVPTTSSTLLNTYWEKNVLSNLTLRRRKLISILYEYPFLTSQITQFVFIIKMNQLMLYREKAAVYCCLLIIIRDTYTHVHTCTYTHMYTYTHAHIHKYTYTRIHTCTHTQYKAYIMCCKNSEMC
jgi:hypothetical protein